MWWSLKKIYRQKTVGKVLRLLALFEDRAAITAGDTRLVAKRDPAIEVLLDLVQSIWITSGVAPALVNAIYDAVGVRLRQIPAIPERVWRAIQKEGR